MFSGCQPAPDTRQPGLLFARHACRAVNWGERGGAQRHFSTARLRNTLLIGLAPEHLAKAAANIVPIATKLATLGKKQGAA
jgi:hypothetical protein